VTLRAIGICQTVKQEDHASSFFFTCFIMVSIELDVIMSDDESDDNNDNDDDAITER
jgi:hypothetical protein